MDKTVQVVDHDTAAQPLPGPLDEVVSSVKPRLRGWLHAGTSPLALAAGIVLISQAPTSAGVIGGVVFLTASVLLFGTSGLYHRFTWSRRGGRRSWTRTISSWCSLTAPHISSSRKTRRGG